MINYSDKFSKNFKEVDLSSKTEAYLRQDNKDVKCETLDDYKEFAKQIQKQRDYYFTLKLDGNVVWSNEEGIGTDTPEKVRPKRTKIEKPNADTLDSRNIVVAFFLLLLSIISLFKLRKKNTI